jgi:competence protein ComEA
MEPIRPAPWRAVEAPAAGDASVPSSEGSSALAGDRAAEHSGARRIVLIAVAAVACAGAAFVLATGGSGGSFGMHGGSAVAGGASLGVDRGTDDAGAADAELVVEVVGAVRRPGVYRMAAGSRVADLVEKAGGYSPRIDTALAEARLNLAAPLKDGDQIRVPARGDDALPEASGAPGGTGAAGGTGANRLVDLNHATQAELEALPGIGPATAEKIIAGREEAPFNAVEELRSRGILGEKTFEKLRGLVTVG